MTMNEHNVNGIVEAAEGLIIRLNVYMMHYYLIDYEFIMNGLLEPEMRDKVLACYDEKHRPSIEKWNQTIHDLMLKKGFLC